MAIPLRVAATPDSQASADWREYVRRRETLVEQMEMSTCDGCDGCGLRCMDGFLVTREEYDAVQKYLQTLPATDVARVLGQTKIVPWPGAENDNITVTYCRYRDMEKGNCFIYPARPTVCRIFGHTPWLPCPIGAVQCVPDGSAELWNDYRRYPRKTWDGWDSGHDVPASGAPQE